MRISSVLIIYLFFTILSSANNWESPFFLHYNDDNSALSYNGVRAVTQDSRGYLWVGTHRGLNRYDGANFRSYGIYNLGIESDYIYSITEDLRGHIWIGTNNGISVYDPKTDSFTPLSTLSGTEINDRIFTMACDANGNMWIGTRSSGLYLYNPDKKKIQKYKLADTRGNDMNCIYRIVIDHSGRLLINVYCRDIYSFEPESMVLKKIIQGGRKSSFANEDVEGMILDPHSDDILYVAGKRNGLCRLTISTGDVTTLIPMEGGNRPTALDLSDRHILWLSSTNGLFRYDIHSEECRIIRNNPDDGHSLSDSHTTASCIDNKGNLWVGTNNGGLNLYDISHDNFNKFRFTDRHESLAGCIVRGFAETTGGNVWIATGQSGLLHLDRDDRLRHVESESIPRNLTALCADGDYLWIGTQNGVLKLTVCDSSILEFRLNRKNSSASDNRITSIFRTEAGEIYAATALGVLKYVSDKDGFHTVDKLENLTIEGMAQDSEGKIWMASYSDGTYIYDPIRNTLEHYCARYGKSRLPDMTSSLCINDNDVWVISFNSGFYQYCSDGSFRTFNRRSLPLLPTDVFYSATMDFQGNMWLSSDKGLVRFSPRQSGIKVFTENDGILDNRFKNSALTLSDGRILMGSENGFIRFNPASLNKVREAVAVKVSSFIIDGKTPEESAKAIGGNIDMMEKITLAPDENSFELSLSTPASRSADYSQLLCRLVGIDTVWRHADAGQSVHFSKLSPGNYTLEMAIEDNEGTSTTAHNPILLTVTPPFWQSATGICLFVMIVLIAAGIIFLIVYRRTIAMERRKRIEYERIKEAELYKEKISFFSNVVHEIKTPLTLIMTPVRQILARGNLNREIISDLKLIDNSVVYLDKLTRELLEFVRIEKHHYELNFIPCDIAEKLEFLYANICEEARSRNLTTEFVHDGIDSAWVNADDAALTKMLNNLLYNALKYAETWIEVRLERDGESYNISISNDGTPIPAERRDNIFKPFVTYSSGGGLSQGFGIGLSMSKSFAEMHGGTLRLSSSETPITFLLRIPAADAIEQAENCERDTVYESDCSKPLVVIAEDNPNLSAYMAKKLSADYRVIAVPTAWEAYKSLKEHDASLLITDIALGGMSGIELCKKVTSDIDISHIPVVVVSAITSVDTKIECMESGAALYIEKPFDVAYLMSCIKRLLEKRAQLPESISEKGIDGVDTDKFALPDIDGQFIAKLERIVADNLHNPAFSSKQLEEMMYLSHSTLNRKMKALFNSTPTDYIRTRRLTVAAGLLENTNSRINEIAAAVGFSTPAYFSKLFKERYGILPGEYRAKAADSAQTND